MGVAIFQVRLQLYKHTVNLHVCIIGPSPRKLTLSITLLLRFDTRLSLNPNLPIRSVTLPRKLGLTYYAPGTPVILLSEDGQASRCISWGHSNEYLIC